MTKAQEYIDRSDYQSRQVVELKKVAKLLLDRLGRNHATFSREEMEHAEPREVKLTLEDNGGRRLWIDNQWNT